MELRHRTILSGDTRCVDVIDYRKEVSPAKTERPRGNIMTSINGSGLIGLMTLNARSGVVRNNLLLSDGSLNFATESSKDQGKGQFDLIERQLGNLDGFRYTKLSLSAIDTALTAALKAGGQVKETVTELGALAIQAKASNIEQDIREEIVGRFETLRNRLGGMVDQGSVNGHNLIAQKVAPIRLKDADGKSISVISQDLSAQGLGIGHVRITLPSEATVSLKAIKRALIKIDTRLTALTDSATHITDALDAAHRITNLHVEGGVKDLIEADLTTKNAELRAIDIRQRLGESALAIANVNGFSLVGLFRPGVGEA